MITLPSKFPDLGLSIFPKMTQLAIENQAINLAQGFPGFPMDEKIIENAYQWMLQGKNQYSPMPGILELRTVLAENQKVYQGVHYDPIEEITITCGATEGVFSTIATLVHSGDEVIVFDPVFDIYPPAISLQGAKTVRIALEGENFEYPWEKVRDAITSRTRMIILNSPHNPTGKVLTKKDIETLAEIVKNTSILLLSDEVYEHMVFDGKEHVCVAAHPELYQQTIVVASLGKVFHCTGWRVGYILAPQFITKEIRKVHQFVTFSAHTGVQYALAEALTKKENIQSLSSFFEKKRNLFLSSINQSIFQFKPSEGTYFQLVQYPIDWEISDVDMAHAICTQYKVASIPVSVFHGDKHDGHWLRFCFAKEDAEIAEAGKRLSEIRNRSDLNC